MHPHSRDTRLAGQLKIEAPRPPQPLQHCDEPIMTDDIPYTHPFRVADLPGKKPTRFRLIPDAAALARIAEDLGLLGLRGVSLQGELRPQGRHDWELDAKLTATVTQACVVTLAPVKTVIAEVVKRRFLSEMPDIAGDEVEMPEDDTAEPLGAVIDAGAVLTEALALALPLYPRAKGAELGALQIAAPGAAPLTDETIRPFAGLADLLRKPEGEKP